MSMDKELIKIEIPLPYIGGGKITVPFFSLATLQRIVPFLNRSKKDDRMKTTFSAIAALLERKENKDFEVEHVKTLAELKAVWEFDQITYGDDNVSFAVLKSWWEAFPQGVITLKKQGKLIGGTGVYPVTKAWVTELKKHKTTEHLLTKEVIKEASKSCGHWYIADITVLKEARSGLAIPFLIARTVGICLSLYEETNCPVAVYAIANTHEGRSILNKLKFEACKQKSNISSDNAVYTKNFTRKELQSLVNTL